MTTQTQTAEKPALTIGQKLWFVPSGKHMGNHREVTVIKIGRKWFYTDDDRGRRGFVDCDGIFASSETVSCPGQFWLSREASETEIYRRKLWYQLGLRVTPFSTCVPSIKISADAIIEAGKLLGMDLETAVKS